MYASDTPPKVVPKMYPCTNATPQRYGLHKARSGLEACKYGSRFTVGRNPMLALYRGHEAEDIRRPFTIGPRPMIPVALYRGHEGDDSRRPLPWSRG